MAISYTMDRVYVYDDGREYYYDQNNSQIMGYLSDADMVAGCGFDDFLNWDPQHWGYRVNLAGKTIKYQGTVTSCREIWKDSWETNYGNELTHLINADLKKCYSKYPRNVMFL